MAEGAYFRGDCISGPFAVSGGRFFASGHQCRTGSANGGAFSGQLSFVCTRKSASFTLGSSERKGLSGWFSVDRCRWKYLSEFDCSATCRAHGGAEGASWPLVWSKLRRSIADQYSWIGRQVDRQSVLRGKGV